MLQDDRDTVEALRSGSNRATITAARHYSTPPARRVEVITPAGTHIFSPRDRLWVRCAAKPEPRPVTELRPGDLVAFLGRVVAVRSVTDDGERRES
jgi:hypothetical protein